MVEESPPVLPPAQKSIEAEPESDERTLESTGELGFACEVRGQMRSACKSEPVYGMCDGKRYCVLHYPGNNKAAAFKRTLQRKLNESDFDFRGVWFPYEISFKLVEFTSDACFDWATFSGDAEFSTFHAGARFCFTTFSGVASFDSVTFNADANFGNASFSAGATFNQSTFWADADFSSAHFNADVDFGRARFGAEADFGHATFSAVADFSFATFEGIAVFGSATFGAFANFTSSTFYADAVFNSVNISLNSSFDFAHFDTMASFTSTTFSGEAYFRSATFLGHAYFNAATFGANLYFTLATFRSKGDFGSAAFGADAYFSHSEFQADADFGKATFAKGAYFSGALFNARLSLSGIVNQRSLKDGTRLSKRALGLDTSVDLQHARFEKPHTVSFHTLVLRPHWFVNIDSRSFVLTDVRWNWDGIRIRQEIEALAKKGVAEPHRLLVITCRQLAENAESNNRYEEASRFRYWAMELARHTKWRQWTFWKTDWLHMLYWAVSGYGEKILRALGVLVAVWIVFVLLYTRVGFTQQLPKPSNEGVTLVVVEDRTGRPLEFSRALTYSLAVMSLQKPEPKPLTGTAQTLVLLETILGPVQAALLALAIRRKFMR